MTKQEEKAAKETKVRDDQDFPMTGSMIALNRIFPYDEAEDVLKEALPVDAAPLPPSPRQTDGAIFSRLPLALSSKLVQPSEAVHLLAQGGVDADSLLPFLPTLRFVMMMFRPKCVFSIGTGKGGTYLSLCEAAELFKLDTKLHAVMMVGKEGVNSSPHDSVASKGLASSAPPQGGSSGGNQFNWKPWHDARLSAFSTLYFTPEETPIAVERAAFNIEAGEIDLLMVGTGVNPELLSPLLAKLHPDSLILYYGMDTDRGLNDIIPTDSFYEVMRLGMPDSKAHLRILKRWMGYAEDGMAEGLPLFLTTLGAAMRAVQTERFDSDESREKVAAKVVPLRAVEAAAPESSEFRGNDNSHAEIVSSSRPQKPLNILTEKGDGKRLSGGEQNNATHKDRLIEALLSLRQDTRQQKGSESEIQRLKWELIKTHESLSWKITAPLRFVKSCFTHPRGAAITILRTFGLTGVARSTLYGLSAVMPTQGLKQSVGKLTGAEAKRAANAKAEFRAESQAALEKHLRSGSNFDFTLPEGAVAKTSVLLVLYNQCELTFRCLQSLYGELRRAIAMNETDSFFELILVDNASRDKTGELLDTLFGVKIHRSNENLHFLRGVNLGANVAEAPHLLLLNNDAELHRGAISQAVDTLRRYPQAGAVGAKIILPDGTLQEAGSIIWKDGSCLGYGRGGNPDDGRYNYLRAVDYCSGAFLMLRRDLFEQLGRLDEAFAPAYYEETDFCMRLQDAGWQVLYDPRVVITHYEFGSSAKPEAAIAMQRERHKLFVERHRATLEEQHLEPKAEYIHHAATRLVTLPAAYLVEESFLPPHDSAASAGLASSAPPQGGSNSAASSFTPSPLEGEGWGGGISSTNGGSNAASHGRILIIDDRVPHAALGAGYPRAREIVHQLTAQGWQVTFYPLQFPTDNWNAIRASLPETVEVILESGRMHLAPFLKERHGFYDTILVSRPHNMQVVDSIARSHPALLQGMRMVYDAEALFSLREAKRHEVQNSPWNAETLRRKVAEELGLARLASRVLAVSNEEARHFRDAGFKDVAVVGHALHPEPTPENISDRKYFLFIGALDEDGSPNADSLEWFVKDVWPQITPRLPEAKLLVIGRASAPSVKKLASDSVILLGRVPDTSAFYEAARVFIAPTRFAAGIPHKIHEAASKGVPVVCTSLLAKQVGWKHDEVLLVADSSDGFAAECLRLWEEDTVWRRLREAALHHIAEDCSPDAFAAELQKALA